MLLRGLFDMVNKTGFAIGTIPSFSIIALAVGLMNHVMVIPSLLQEAKRDAWLSVLAMILPYIIWTLILYYIMKKTKQQPIVTWLQGNYGTVISVAFRFFHRLSIFDYCFNGKGNNHLDACLLLAKNATTCFIRFIDSFMGYSQHFGNFVR